MNKEQLAVLVRERDIRIVDLKFVDLPGLWQHFTVPVAEMDDDIWVHGLGFDGSSIRGFQAIQESDMLIVPDIDTAVLDPATEEPTISLICDIHDPVRKQPYSRDPRSIARKAEAFLKSQGKFDTSYWGPEAEFFVFDDIRYDQTRTPATTSSTPSRGGGTAAATSGLTWATRSRTRRVTSRCRRTTR